MSVEQQDSERGGIAQSFRFRLVDIVIVVTVMCVLFAIGAVIIQGARDKQHRQQCSDNAILIVVNMHHFENVRRKLPPVTLGPGRPSFLMQMSPFLELKSPAFELERGKLRGAHLELVWDRLSAGEKERESLVAYQCPTRSRRRLRMSGIGRGPGTDYATPVLVDTGEWTSYYDPCNALPVERFLSPLRPAVVDCSVRPVSYLNSQPRDGFNRLIDGFSNIIAIAEKHVRPKELSKCCGSTWRTGADGSSLFADDQHRMYSIARSAKLPIAKSPHNWAGVGSNDGGPDDDFSFGSWHHGVFTVAFMDGSVRALSVDVEPHIIESLVNVEDGLDTGLE